MSNKIIFFKHLSTSPKAELLYSGYSRRTTAAEPRLSELVAEYKRIGYDVQVVEYQVEANGCGVCYEAGAQVGEVYGDIYVRRRPVGEAGATDKPDECGN
jgi:hypothetical protein